MRRARSLVVFTGLAVSGCDRVPFFASADEKATRACEERLKSDLVSPASYRRLSASAYPGSPITKADMLRSAEEERVQAAKAGDDAEALINAYIVKCMKKPDAADCKGFQKFDEARQPNTRMVLLEYESANAFNTRLRGFFSCRLVNRDDGKYTADNVFSAAALPDAIGRRLKSQAEFLKSHAAN